ncbi:hypothetical protein BCR37DRAFT_382424 [Protomyces lactucae-debilis]|uniref:Uncharacterized protein n=1 Tax=Protomyces lactucae-debilis TaxID=2754530 RepID=A0A1Y2F5F5_PROLT|nr:uncharacterized protein BCR37DRAFT_382424 [Protomyces lactucae-debilis]ORY78165.1 hypothetical protein BCR37DRAFT_382424 [Protomyces lactucae-debilis]
MARPALILAPVILGVGALIWKTAVGATRALPLLPTIVISRRLIVLTLPMDSLAEGQTTGSVILVENWHVDAIRTAQVAVSEDPVVYTDPQKR